jgi:hypothetical protein
VRQLDNVLAFFVFLRQLERLLLHHPRFTLVSRPCALTYFQPSVVLQFSHDMSATACRPVSSTRSSAGPHLMFTLSRCVCACNAHKCTYTELNRYALP